MRKFISFSGFIVLAGLSTTAGATELTMVKGVRPSKKVMLPRPGSLGLPTIPSGTPWKSTSITGPCRCTKIWN